MKKSTKIVFSFVFIALGIFLSIIGFSNLKNLKKSYFNLSRENSSLVEKKSKSEEKLRILSDDLNNKRSKIDTIDNELKKFDIIENKSMEIDEVNESVCESIIPFQKNNFDNFYKMSDKKLNNFKPLSGNFIANNLNEDEVNSNLIITPYIVNSYINFDLNRNIAKHNVKCFEMLGIIDYLKNGNNYFLKSILLNDNSKISKLKDGKDNILKDEFQFFLVYKNIFENSNDSKYFIDKADEYLESYNIKVEDEDSFKVLNALCIDILNSSVNYLYNFEIVDSNDEKILRNKDFVMMQEKINHKDKITTYHNKVSNNFYVITEEKE